MNRRKPNRLGLLLLSELCYKPQLPFAVEILWSTRFHDGSLSNGKRCVGPSDATGVQVRKVDGLPCGFAGNHFARLLGLSGHCSAVAKPTVDRGEETQPTGSRSDPSGALGPSRRALFRCVKTFTDR